MLARPDMENEGWFWIDRGGDGRADRFAPCPACQELLGGLGQASGRQPADLVPGLWLPPGDRERHLPGHGPATADLHHGSESPGAGRQLDPDLGRAAGRPHRSGR